MTPEDRVEKLLLFECADKHATRDDVALTYAFGLRLCREEIDWVKVNHAIIERWSKNALKYIKTRAWRLAAPGVTNPRGDADNR